jgi:hypothetical protein
MLPDVLMIRPMKAEDEAFVYGTWLRQLWYAKTNTSTLNKATFFKVYHNQVGFLMRHNKGLVAALKDDPEVIIGYLVDTQPTPFTYVRKAWRDVGVELALKREIEE